jgi:DNA-binding transcriptional LysR family regulator
MHMELRHLRYFVTVAAESSFSRASEKLHIAQPPLSRQIQQLEEELGTQLLHRGRPITLTESGRYFFEQALQVLQRTDEIRAMTRCIGAGKKRQFGIGFVASTLYSALPELIRRLRLMAPDVEIVLSELTTLEQAAALKEGRIDIGFGRLRFDGDGLTRQVIREEKLSVAAPHGHLLSRMRRPLKLKHTADVPLILYPKRRARAMPIRSCRSIANWDSSRRSASRPASCRPHWALSPLTSALPSCRPRYAGSAAMTSTTFH